MFKASCLHVVGFVVAHPGAYPPHQRRDRQTDYRPNPPLNVNFLNLLILGTGEVGDDGDDGLCDSSRLIDSRGLFPLLLLLVVVLVYS
jgi:hypothetical protein